ncbi:hypothetical protein HG15A2_08240 [Adhaeretor mobilis]|uniref:Uncharacterized protein n=1 Tax=Adhaeretor mobilis TaxID=1930276 RepID=A0A517MRQ4_9BACT|nr:hypothetical protein HG15A2_08240 [Adhaeretor mobilis]
MVPETGLDAMRNIGIKGDKIAVMYCFNRFGGLAMP